MTASNRSSTIEVLEQIQETVSCGICLLPFTDPRMLFCNHEFCKKCLESLVAKQQEKVMVTCPVCRSKTSLPPGEGIAGLKPAFHLQKLLDLESSLQRQVQEAVTCARHENEKVCFFCEPCEALICNQCIVEDHNGHIHKKMGEMCKKYKEDMATELEKATTVLAGMDTLKTTFEVREEEISAQKDSLEHQINAKISQLQQALETKRLSLISMVQELSSTKLESLNRKKHEANELQTKLESSTKDCLILLDDQSEETVITRKEACLEAVKKDSSDCQGVDTNLPEEANMSLAADNSNSILQSIDTFATITTCNVSPQNCYAQGDALSSAWAGKTAIIRVHVMDKTTQPCTEGSLNDIEFKISSDIGEIDSGIAKRMKGNQYEFSYTPKSKGYYQLSITIREQHISGSPFRVAVKSPIASLWIPSHSFTIIQSPSGIAIDQNGDVLVVSETKRCITVLKQTGKVIRETEEVGIFADVTVGDDNSIYTVNTADNQVVKLTQDGSVLEKTEPHVKLNAPMGIAFNSSNKKLYISNTNSHEILVLDEELSHHMTIGREGTGKLQFNSPRGICCDSTGRVFVADSNNNRIQVFTAEGKFLKIVGQTGDQPGCLKWPLGIATDTSRRIYVSEGANNRVSIFGATGNFLRCFGGEGVMKKPCGIAVDSNCGTVLVCNYGHNLIQIY